VTRSLDVLFIFRLCDQPPTLRHRNGGENVGLWTKRVTTELQLPQLTAAPGDFSPRPLQPQETSAPDHCSPRRLQPQLTSAAAHFSPSSLQPQETELLQSIGNAPFVKVVLYFE
jgi:hypothetical protein